jgi:hypothetical protein
MYSSKKLVALVVVIVAVVAASAAFATIPGAGCDSQLLREERRRRAGDRRHRHELQGHRDVARLEPARPSRAPRDRRAEPASVFIPPG